MVENSVHPIRGESSCHELRCTLPASTGGPHATPAYPCLENRRQHGVSVPPRRCTCRMPSGGRHKRVDSDRRGRVGRRRGGRDRCPVSDCDRGLRASCTQSPESRWLISQYGYQQGVAGDDGAGRHVQRGRQRLRLRLAPVRRERAARRWRVLRRYHQQLSLCPR